MASTLCAAASTPLTVSLSRSGLVEASKGGTALTSDYLFFGAKFAWSSQQAEMSKTGERSYSVRGVNKNLGLTLDAQVTTKNERRIEWRWQWTANRSVPDAIGGGVVFKFSLGAYADTLGEPVLLPDRQGWAWGKTGGERIEMRFDPPLEDVFFEAGRKNEIRAYFYSKGIEPGEITRNAVLTISNGAVVPPRAERHGPVDRAKWAPNLLLTDESPIDLSFLNADDKPAGSRGFIRARGEQLVYPDGTPVRFWGTNIAAYALFRASKDDVKTQAGRLARLGYNLVRLHHHDSPWVNPNIFGDVKRPSTRQLSADSLDRLDWWVKCLQDEGIYVWLDMHSQRNFKREDGIERFDEIAKGKDSVDPKGYSYINPSIQAAMRELNDAYLNHLNPYTQLRNKDNPAVLALLLTNENDFTSKFGNSMLPDKNVPWHSALYMKEAQAFAKTSGLPRDRTWRSWEPGPGKVFLNDMEYRVHRTEIERLKRSGVRALTASTSTWGANPLSSLPALLAGDVIDAHAYGKTDELSLDPAYMATMAHWLAAAQVAGRPTTVTEWNMDPTLEPDRHTVPLYIAATAAAQGWDAMMHYAYTQEPLRGAGSASVWHAYNDPAITALMPAAALLYRQGHVAEATSVYAYTPSRQQLFDTHLHPGNAIALRSATERGKLVIALPAAPELPWLTPTPVPANARRFSDVRQNFLPAGAAQALSDNGELRRHWGTSGHFVVDTPRSRLASGWIGGKTIEMSGAEVSLETPNATVAIQSLDDKPIAESGDIFVSWAARAVATSGNRLPYLSEPLSGTVTVRARPGLKMHGLGPRGEARAASFQYEDGLYVIDLNALSSSTHWLRLRAP